MADETVLQGIDGRANTCEVRNLEWLVPICYTNCTSSFILLWKFVFFPYLETLWEKMKRQRVA